jgi:hypothetical protein
VFVFVVIVNVFIRAQAGLLLLSLAYPHKPPLPKAGRVGPLFGVVPMNILSHPDRSHGVKSASGKHAKREDQAFFELRKYFEVHHGNTDAEKNSELKMVLSKGCKCVGFEKNDVPNGIRHNGIMDHYHLYTCHELGLRFAAVRRYPCSCNACHSKIMLPWDNTLPLKSREDRAKQPRFQHVPDCKYAEIFEELNDWKII